jgi:hypothetical protein
MDVSQFMAEQIAIRRQLATDALPDDEVLAHALTGISETRRDTLRKR